MKNYKLTLSYDGTRYNGWQKQKNTPDTIQEKLETLLSRLLGAEIEVAGSGRTDAGVHALGQVCSFRAECGMSCEELLAAIREYLPADIGALSLEEAEPRFHARLNARAKTYEYRIRTSIVPDVFARKYRYVFTEKLDVNAMRAAAEKMCGEHDYSAFCSIRMKKSAVRTVYSIDISESGGEMFIRFRGNGFLYNMVRIMTGTLLDVGTGKIAPEDIDNIIESKLRQNAGFTAPPQGLFLVNVEY